jgi:hypothetical protein
MVRFTAILIKILFSVVDPNIRSDPKLFLVGSGSESEQRQIKNEFERKLL